MATSGMQPCRCSQNDIPVPKNIGKLSVVNEQTYVGIPASFGRATVWEEQFSSGCVGNLLQLLAGPWVADFIRLCRSSNS